MQFAAPLDPLARHPQIEEWWQSGPVSVPYLGGKAVPFVLTDFDDDAQPEDFHRAVEAFLSLTVEARDAATPGAYADYQDMGEACGFEELPEIADAASVWDFVQPHTVYVTRNVRGDGQVYIQVSCECDWEQEHGLQLNLRGGTELTRVSAADGRL